MKDQFMRIAMARLKSIYPFKPQRRAVAAKMWVRFTKKKLNDGILSWREEEDALNRRMDIIGQNGNEGNHYEKSH